MNILLGGSYYSYGYPFSPLLFILAMEMMLREAKQGDGWVMPPMEVLVEGDTEAASLAN